MRCFDRAVQALPAAVCLAIRQNNKYRVKGGPGEVAWFPSRLGLMGSLSH